MSNRKRKNINEDKYIKNNKNKKESNEKDKIYKLLIKDGKDLKIDESEDEKKYYSDFLAYITTRTELLPTVLLKIILNFLLPNKRIAQILNIPLPTHKYICFDITKEYVYIFLCSKPNKLIVYDKLFKKIFEGVARETK